MNAICEATGQYVPPEDAQKGKRYKCPDCEQELIVKKGKKKRAHYAHKKGEECKGKDSKERLREQIIDGTIRNVSRECIRCGRIEIYEIPEGECETNYGTADVAIHEGGIIRAIFEMKPQRNDPPSAPWYKISENFRVIRNTIECNRMEICKVCETRERIRRRYTKEYKERCREYIEEYISSRVKGSKIERTPRFGAIYIRAMRKIAQPGISFECEFWSRKSTGTTMEEMKEINKILKEDDLKNPVKFRREMYDIL